MNRKAKILVASIFFLGAVAGVSYLALKPRWETASRAEVDRLIDPVLLKVQSSDPVAIARGERLGVLLHDLESPNFVRIRALFMEGPVESHPQTFLRFDYENAKAVRRLAKGLASRTANRALSIEERLAAVELGALAATRMLQGARGTLDTTCDLATLTIVEKSIREFLASAKLTSAQQTRLLAALPNVDELTELQPAIVDDFQTQIYPLLPDPRVLLDSAMGKELHVSSINELEGSYDALLTAKESSDASMEQIRACQLPVNSIATPKCDRIQKIVDSLPPGPNPARKGLSMWWGIQVFRYEIAKIPNSFGYLIIPITEMRGLVAMRDDIRAWDRLIRLEIACSRYGSIPKKLDDLASAGLIAAVPKDPFDGRAMKFDPERRLVWSVGRDGIDNHGANLPLVQNIPADDAVKLSIPRKGAQTKR